MQKNEFGASSTSNWSFNMDCIVEESVVIALSRVLPVLACVCQLSQAISSAQAADSPNEVEPKLVGACGKDDTDGLDKLEDFRNRLFEGIDASKDSDGGGPPFGPGSKYLKALDMAAGDAKGGPGSSGGLVKRCSSASPGSVCKVTVYVVLGANKAACAAFLPYCRLEITPNIKTVKFVLHERSEYTNMGYKFTFAPLTVAGAPNGVEIYGAQSGPLDHFNSPKRAADGSSFTWERGTHGTDRLTYQRPDQVSIPLPPLPVWPVGGLRHEANVIRTENGGNPVRCIPRDPIMVNTGD